MGLLDDEVTTELLNGARRGEGEAWSQLVLQHSPRLRRLAGILLDPRLRARVDPEDVVQETLVDAFQALAMHDQEPVSFSTWLRQLLRNRVHQLHRAHRETQGRSVAREVAPPDGAEGSALSSWMALFLDPGSTPSRRAMRAEDDALIHEALARLPKLDLEILVLLYYERHSVAEVALILALRPDNVRVRRHRAVCQLTAQLRHSHPEWCHAFRDASRSA